MWNVFTSVRNDLLCLFCVFSRRFVGLCVCACVHLAHSKHSQNIIFCFIWKSSRHLVWWRRCCHFMCSFSTGGCFCSCRLCSISLFVFVSIQFCVSELFLCSVAICQMWLIFSNEMRIFYLSFLLHISYAIFPTATTPWRVNENENVNKHIFFSASFLMFSRWIVIVAITLNQVEMCATSSSSFVIRLSLKPNRSNVFLAHIECQ